LAAEPGDDGVLVHQVPCSIEVEEGKTVTIEVKADNYEPQTIVIDDRDASKVVKLLPLKGFRPQKPLVGTDKNKGKGTNGGTDVRDPWKNK